MRTQFAGVPGEDRYGNATTRILAEGAFVKTNRRNHYRILHVQPEAPQEVIAAAYRAMMSKLRLHPDLGGEHEAAVLVNQAYAVLRDSAKRSQYDRSLQHERTRSDLQARSSTVVREAVSRPDAQPGCLFCGADMPSTIYADARCRRCDSPLVPAPPRPARKCELFGRRSVPRIPKSDVATIYPGWQMQARSTRLRDLSTTGISMVTDIALQANQVIRVVGPLFDVLASVVSCRPNEDGSFVIHACLLSAIFAKQTGVFVSVAA